MRRRLLCTLTIIVSLIWLGAYALAAIGGDDVVYVFSRALGRRRITWARRWGSPS